jgi:multiple antibiotic resistance protein
MPSIRPALLLFLALFGLYGPLAALSSYFPIVGKLKPADQTRLVFGLFTYVAAFALFALWVGEPLLKRLGVSTAALLVTGGIALLYSAMPILRGGEPRPKESEGGPAQRGAPVSWRSVLFMPVTFPLTVGSTTFAFFVAYRAEAKSIPDVIALSMAGLLHAAVTAVTLYASCRLERRASPDARRLLDSLAGVLLAATAVMLLLYGGPRLVVEMLGGLKK